MRLEKIQEYLREVNLPYQYTEYEKMGSIDLEYRGVPYHIWEFYDEGYGVESNVENAGKSIDYTGDYESEVIGIMRGWE
ncbi:MAG: kinase [Lachnospiraceae bacterium]|jgi:hypothetical protein|nr:kinase [Lachnospiraceae bacterium]MDD3616637.1 kinase [Lachnospiraceae bacterium]